MPFSGNWREQETTLPPTSTGTPAQRGFRARGRGNRGGRGGGNHNWHHSEEDNITSPAEITANATSLRKNQRRGRSAEECPITEKLPPQLLRPAVMKTGADDEFRARWDSGKALREGLALATRQHHHQHTEKLQRDADRLLLDGQFERAVEVYTEAIAECPHAASLYNNRSACFFALEKFELALADGREAARLCPLRAMGHSRVAEALIRLDRMDEACEAVQAALAADPAEDGQVQRPLRHLLRHYTHLGHSARKEQRFADAVGLYTLALKLCPTETTLLALRLECLAHLHRFEEALQDAMAWKLLEPNTLEAVSREGGLLLRLHRYADAVLAYRAALSIAPGDTHLERRLTAALSRCSPEEVAELERPAVEQQQQQPPSPALCAAEQLTALEPSRSTNGTADDVGNVDDGNSSDSSSERGGAPPPPTLPLERKHTHWGSESESDGDMFAPRGGAGRRRSDDDSDDAVAPQPRARVTTTSHRQACEPPKMEGLQQENWRAVGLASAAKHGRYSSRWGALR